MPLYEYQCEACGRRFEVIQKMSDSPVEVCTLCGKGPVRQLLSSPAIQFKGSGWYITDYAKKSGSTESAEPKGEKKSDGAADQGSTKTETKTETSTVTPASTPSTTKD